MVQLVELDDTNEADDITLEMELAFKEWEDNEKRNDPIFVYYKLIDDMITVFEYIYKHKKDSTIKCIVEFLQFIKFNKTLD